MITFIIPSLQRKTLRNTLISLLKQEDPDWKAIVNFDGIKNPYFPVQDDRIRYIESDKVRRCGGIIRNEAANQAETTWVGFVDDDDILEKNYITALKEELEKDPDADCVVFRMKKGSRIIPNPLVKNFEKIERGGVGISFCLNKKIFDNGIKFIPSRLEDFYLLQNIMKNNYKIILSNYCVYKVRPRMPKIKFL